MRDWKKESTVQGSTTESVLESTEESGGQGFKIDFIGLVCFLDRGEARLAYFPDGRNENGQLGNIPAHHARIIVPSAPEGEPQSVLEADWWPDHDDTEVRTFPILEPVELEISGLDGRGVDATQQALLPKLSIDDSLVVDERNANTIARLTIRAGRLSAFEFEGSAVSQLEIPDHDREIIIRATTRDGKVRTIVLRPGTEIVIRNSSEDLTGGADETAHFRIYRQLAPNSDGTLSVPDTDFEALQDLESEHPNLAVDVREFGGRNCSNMRSS